MLKAPEYERVRKFRVGDYRIFFMLERETIEVQGHEYVGTLVLLNIRNRKDAY
jgi:mRNA-degrading endonuclease RelE of RelBE toxin-antitoxin system